MQVGHNREHGFGHRRDILAEQAEHERVPFEIQFLVAQLALLEVVVLHLVEAVAAVVTDLGVAAAYPQEDRKGLVEEAATVGHLSNV